MEVYCPFLQVILVLRGFSRHFETLLLSRQRNLQIYTHLLKPTYLSATKNNYCSDILFKLCIFLIHFNHDFIKKCRKPP